MIVVGAANGRMQMTEALADGIAAAAAVARDLGGRKVTTKAPAATDWPFAISPCWHVPSGKVRAWLDFQNDVTTKDVKQAHLKVSVRLNT